MATGSSEDLCSNPDHYNSARQKVKNEASRRKREPEHKGPRKNNPGIIRGRGFRKSDFPKKLENTGLGTKGCRPWMKNEVLSRRVVKSLASEGDASRNRVGISEQTGLSVAGPTENGGY